MGLCAGLYEFASGIVYSFVFYCIIFTLFTLLRYHGVFELRPPKEKADECPFPPLSTVSKKKDPKLPCQITKEFTCSWLNLFIEKVIFNAGEGRVANMIQDVLLNRIVDKISADANSRLIVPLYFLSCLTYVIE